MSIVPYLPISSLKLGPLFASRTIRMLHRPYAIAVGSRTAIVSAQAKHHRVSNFSLPSYPYHHPISLFERHQGALLSYPSLQSPLGCLFSLSLSLSLLSLSTFSLSSFSLSSLSPLFLYSLLAPHLFPLFSYLKWTRTWTFFYCYLLHLMCFSQPSIIYLVSLAIGLS